jgi:signal transduction histidine kinase
MSADRAGGRGPEYPAMLPATLEATAHPGGGRARRSLRDWLTDGLCVLCALLMGLLSLWVRDPDVVPSISLPLSLAVSIAACLSLWFRRRWPVQLALVLMVLSVWFVHASGASAIALFTVAVHRKTATVIPLLVLGVLSPLVQFRIYRLEPDTPLVYWMAVGIAATLSVLAVLWGMGVRARRQLVVSLAERAERAEAEQELRVSQGRLRERERIAREMHDVLAHRLSLLSMHAGALEFRPDAPPEEISQAAGVIRSSAYQALVDLQGVIHVLRQAEPEEEGPQPTMADVPVLVEEARAVGTEVEFDDAVTGLDGVPALLGRTTYRIVQEGLTNARKHAPGAVVHLAIHGSPEQGVEISMRNALSGSGARPTGSAPLPGSGVGLTGLRERTSLAGGRFEHGRTMAGEFRIRAWLPWPS